MWQLTRSGSGSGDGAGGLAAESGERCRGYRGDRLGHNVVPKRELGVDNSVASRATELIVIAGAPAVALAHFDGRRKYVENNVKDGEASSTGTVAFGDTEKGAVTTCCSTGLERSRGLERDSWSQHSSEQNSVRRTSEATILAVDLSGAGGNFQDMNGLLGVGVDGGRACGEDGATQGQGASSQAGRNSGAGDASGAAEVVLSKKTDAGNGRGEASHQLAVDVDGPHITSSTANGWVNLVGITFARGESVRGSEEHASSVSFSYGMIWKRTYPTLQLVRHWPVGSDVSSRP